MNDQEKYANRCKSCKHLCRLEYEFMGYHGVCTFKESADFRKLVFAMNDCDKYEDRTEVKNVH